MKYGDMPEIAFLIKIWEQTSAYLNTKSREIDPRRLPENEVTIRYNPDRQIRI